MLVFFTTTVFASLIMVAIFIALAVFGLMMFLDVIKNKKLNETEKLIWMLGMIVTFPIMTIAYYFIARSSIKKKY